MEPFKKLDFCKNYILPWTIRAAQYIDLFRRVQDAGGVAVERCRRWCLYCDTYEFIRANGGIIESLNKCSSCQSDCCVIAFNPLTPRSDQHVISPYNLHTLSSKQVMRIPKLIRCKFLSWFKTKHLSLIYKEICRKCREN